MKKIMWLMALLYGATAYAQKSPYEIEGTMTDWNGGKVMLTYNDSGTERMDTAEVLAGKFKFKGNVAEPLIAKLILITGKEKAARDIRKFYLDGGKVQVNGKDSLKLAVVAGSKLTNEHEELYTLVNPMYEHYKALMLKAILLNGAKDPGLPAVQKEYEALGQRIYEYRKAFVHKYPASFVSLMTVAEMTGSSVNYEKVAPLYEMLSPALKNSDIGLKMGERLSIAKKTHVGVVMADFVSLDTLRKPLRLSDVVKNGRLTLVDFWASWCKPCRAENPNLVKAHVAFQKKGFNILSVSLDHNEASWKKAITKDGMPWFHVSGLKSWDEPIAKQFDINAVPDSFLLDAEGKVVARGLRGEQLYKKIEQLLN